MLDKKIEQLILNTVGLSCECHPYCGPVCARCKRMHVIFDKYSKELRTLYKQNKIKRSGTGNMSYPLFELSEDD